MREKTGTLREKQKEQTRSEIVRAAFELFGRYGYDEVPMERISEAAGVSRATLFNYFPKKELILEQIPRARVGQLKEIAAELNQEGREVSFEDVIRLILRIAEENVRVVDPASTGRLLGIPGGVGLRRLLLKVWVQHASHGSLMANREEAMVVLRGVIERVPKKRPVASRLLAETMFAVFMATTLEWLMREDAGVDWLPATMRDRLELVLAGVA